MRWARPEECGTSLEHDVTTSAAGTRRLGRQVAGRARFTFDLVDATPAPGRDVGWHDVARKRKAAAVLTPALHALQS